MPSDDLRPAAPALLYALRSGGRRRARGGDELMAQIVAERLLRHLELPNFVAKRKPPVKPPHVPEAGA